MFWVIIRSWRSSQTGSRFQCVQWRCQGVDPDTPDERKMKMSGYACIQNLEKFLETK